MSLFVSCLDREASSNFDLFWGLVMYDNEFETKDEIEPQHTYSYFYIAG